MLGVGQDERMELLESSLEQEAENKRDGDSHGIGDCHEWSEKNPLKCAPPIRLDPEICYCPSTPMNDSEEGGK